MRVSFVETMRGTLTDERGAVTTVEFTLHVEAPSTRAFLFDGRCVAKGVVKAPGFTAEAPCEGEVVIARLPPSIGYRLQLRGTDGALLTLTGTKQVALTRVLRTMTTLPVTLTDDVGATRARGVMTFDLEDLVPFLATFSPWSRRPRALVDAARVAARRRALVDSAV
ncbi:MAG: hypothetical protein A2138_26215 [Deltaproteobacteria bacterium RBG_16_71_12]|nr:MAG: hypothetical protein A2138_26215 [Deltaproteobacteria bacterium RBG_16_71_12]